MYRVLLIDDEPLALEGMQLMIDWEKSGFSVVGAYGSSLEALEQIASQKPELVVTDLYMPELGGLELMDRSRARGYAGRFLIVSGYSDFEMARKAIRIGVDGYLLKPIVPEDADEALRRVSEALKREAQEKLRSDGLPKYRAQMTALLSGLDYSREALPTGGAWQLLTWGAPIAYADALQILKECPVGQAQCALHMVDDNEWMTVYSPGVIPEAALETLRELLARRQRELYVCAPTWDVRELREQRRALSVKLSQYSQELLDRVSAVSRAVSLIDRAEAESGAKALERFAATRGEGVKAHASTLLYTACARLLGDKRDALRAPRADGASDIGQTVETALSLLSADVASPSEEIIRISKQRYSQAITLDELADQLGYNAAYLGRLFRKETGMSYRRWLCEYRMKKAAEKLKNTNTPVTEIAAGVGYAKYDNFLEHFKETYRMTPEQYRRSAQPTVSP